MISEAELRKPLAQKSEWKNLDCKERLNWNSASTDAKCQLVKDILAFLNTDDGGVIIFGIHDGRLKLVDANSSRNQSKLKAVRSVRSNG